MAFAGLNVTFGWILAPVAGQVGGAQSLTPAPIYGPSSASQNMAAAATSAVAAVKGPNVGYFPMVSIYAANDSWVTIGANPPDPSVDQPSGGRRFIPATTLIDVFCNVGDKVRWALA